MTFVQFFGDDYFLSWCALWLVWGILGIGALVLELVLKVSNHILRTIKVVCRGWPPEHLDADEIKRRSSDD